MERFSFTLALLCVVAALAAVAAVELGAFAFGYESGYGFAGGIIFAIIANLAVLPKEGS